MLAYSDDKMSLTKDLKVVICDDHPQMRGGVRIVLATMLGCDVVGETETGEGALSLVEQYEPEMIVLDLSLAGEMNGRTVLREIRRKKMPVKVFIHTAFLCRDDFENWFNGPYGPDGIEEKGASDNELALGFTQVLVTGQKYMPMRLLQKFMDGAQVTVLDRLTAKEFHILKLVVRPDLTMKEVANQLSLNPSTVRSYMTTIYTKLELEYHNRTALWQFYRDHQDVIAL